MTELLTGTPSNHDNRSPEVYSPVISHNHAHIHQQIQRDFISPYSSHAI